jgi:tetratricopeptide (TPR) repeat protein
MTTTKPHQDRASDTAAPQADYFISRTGTDAAWAVWIAWELEAAGYSVIVQDWDFRPGSNFISNMRNALDSARTTIAVYSPDYFEAGKYTEDEWTAALVRREDGSIPLLPVRVAIVDIPRLLKPYVYVDFVGVDRDTARSRLLDAVGEDTRSKPSQEPAFPGDPRDEPAFPAADADAASVTSDAAATGTRLVNQAPLETARFADRTTQQAQLRRFLDDPSVRLVSITGRPGIGKTALASRVLTSFGQEANGTPVAAGTPESGIDVILFLDARTTGLSFERLFSDVKGIVDEGAASRLTEFWSRQDVTLAQKVDVLVDSLRERHVLVLLDGLEAALGPDGVVTDDGLRTFIDACMSRAGAPRITATSRVALTLAPEVFPDVRAIPLLEGLETADAIALLKEFDPQGELGLADAADDDLLHAVELTGAIPRALELLAGILRNDPAASLRRLLGDQQIIGAQVVEMLVAEGYRRLGADEQRVMEALAAFDHAVPEDAITFVVHRWNPQVDVRASLRRLTGSYFATASRATGSYLVQSADRAHAYAQIPAPPAGGDAPPGAGEAPPYNLATVESRVADYYLSIRKPPEAWLSIDAVGPQIAEFRHRVLAGEFDPALHVLDLIDREHLFLWGHYTKLIELRRSVLDAPASPSLGAANSASLALASQVLGLYDDALQYYERAVETAGRTGDKAAHSRYVGDLGRLYRNLGYMDRAIASSQEALAAAVEAGDRAAEGRWKDRLGLTYAFVGRLDEGLTLLDEAVASAREFQDRRSEGAAISNRGLILQLQGGIDEAEQAYRDSLAITKEIRDRRGDAIILGRLGFIAEARGDYEGALRLHREALDISQALGERREQSYQLLGLGKTRFGMGQLDEAEVHLRESRDLDMPETSYLAAMALSLVLLRRGSAETDASVADTIRRCDERLGRSRDLFGTRYTRAAALAGSAVLDPGWTNADARPGLLAAAIEERDRAMAICAAPGVVAATVRDLEALVPDEPAALAPLLDPLQEILQQAAPVEPVTPALVPSEGRP